MSDLVLPKDDYQQMLDHCLGFAHQMLQQHREFYPFGAYIHQADGKLRSVAAYEEDVTSKEYIELLYAGYATDSQHIRALCVCYDGLTTLANRFDKSDAVIFEMEHRGGAPVKLFVPYSINERGDVALGEIFANEGSARIFLRNVRN